MSTRCQIAIGGTVKKPEILLYRHSDGYPEAVLPDIMPFLAWFDTARGVDDTEYLGARLLQYLCNKYDTYTKELSKQYEHVKNDYADDFTGILGHGISKEYHGDIEYIYHITDHSVMVYSPKMNFTGPITTGKPIGKINIVDYANSAAYKRLITRE